MDINNLEYIDVVCGLRNLSSSGVDYNDVRYRQLILALNSIRSRRSDNIIEYNTLCNDNNNNPFNIRQYEQLLNQIDAYTNYVSKGLSIPNELLRLCGINDDDISISNDIINNNNCKSPNYPTSTTSTNNQQSNNISNQSINIDNDIINEALSISDAIHRMNEYWGVGNFWLDYKDNLEFNKLTYYLNIVANVRNMLQYLIKINTEDNLKKFYTLVKNVGMYQFITHFQYNNNLKLDLLLDAIITLETHINLLILQKISNPYYYSHHTYNQVLKK